MPTANKRLAKKPAAPKAMSRPADSPNTSHGKPQLKQATGVVGSGRHSSPMQKIDHHGVGHKPVTGVQPTGKRARKTQVNSSGYKPVTGVKGTGKHASSTQKVNAHNSGPYTGKHRRRT